MKKHLFFIIFGILVSCNNNSKTIENGLNAEANLIENKESHLTKDIEALEFNELIKDKRNQLIDVRTADEYNSGTIEHATNIDFLAGDFMDKIKQLDSEVPVVVFCQGGTRSAQAMDVLSDNGFTEVYNLLGGYSHYSSQ